MKKQWRTPIIFGAVLVVLAIAWLVSTLLPDNSDPTATTPSLPDVPLVFEAKAADVDRIILNNEKGGFTLLPYDERAADGTVTVRWTVDGYQDYPLSNSTVNNVANLGLILYGGRIISEAETDLAPFGLDKPKTTVTVKMKNGGSTTISIGNELASGYFDYAIVNGTGPIYTIASSTTARAKSAVVDLLDKTAVVGIEGDKLTGLVLERTRDNLRMVTSCVYNEEGQTYLFEVEEPISRPGNADRLVTLASEAMGIQATAFIEANPQDLAAYGLDKPRYVLELISEDKTVTLSIGNQADAGSYYMISDAFPAVFTVSSSTFTSIDSPLVDMIDRLFALKGIWLVDRIKANLPGAVFSTEIKMIKDQRIDDEATEFFLDGKNAKIVSETGRSLFSAFYQRIIGMQIGGVDIEADPVNTHDASITFFFKADPDSGAPASFEVIEFARRDDYTYYVFIDAVYSGFYVDANRTFLSSETGSEGVVIAYKKMLYAIEHAIDGVFDTTEGYQLD